jgi:uncharacterized membrane protein YadS
MRKLFTDFLAYLSNLGKSETKESSKRSLAIYATIVLGSYVVFRFTNKENMEFVLGELLTFALALLGVTTWEKTTIHKHKSKTSE